MEHNIQRGKGEGTAIAPYGLQLGILISKGQRGLTRFHTLMTNPQGVMLRCCSSYSNLGGFISPGSKRSCC